MTSRPPLLTTGQRGVLIALTAAVAVTALILAAVVALTRTTGTGVTSTTFGQAATTTAPPPPTTSTTVPQTTTTTVEETTTTTTTVEIRESFVLRPDGIDRLFFGADPETVISELTDRLGEPTSDTHWVDQQERYDGLCGGSEARFVTWETVQAFFTDRESAWAREGTRHFASYSVIEGAEDLEFLTARGIGIGSTVGEIGDAYGDEVTFAIHPAYETEVFEIDPPGDGYLIGFLTGLDDEDTATEIVGGFSCGE